MMEYRLYERDDRSHPLVARSFDNPFAAEQWARSWAANSGSAKDYDIEAADRSYSARLFQTIGGQWYIMTT